MALCSAIRINIAITGQESDNLIGQMFRAFVGPKACFWNWRASSTPMAPPSLSSSSPPDLPDVVRVNDLDDLGGGGERVKTNADWVLGEDLHQSPPSISGCRWCRCTPPGSHTVPARQRFCPTRPTPKHPFSPNSAVFEAATPWMVWRVDCRRYSSSWCFYCHKDALNNQQHVYWIYLHGATSVFRGNVQLCF